jgi:hypothetical protein
MICVKWSPTVREESHWHEASPDDHAMFSRVASAARDMDVTLPADLIVQSTSTPQQSIDGGRAADSTPPNARPASSTAKGDRTTPSPAVNGRVFSLVAARHDLVDISAPGIMAAV